MAAATVNSEITSGLIIPLPIVTATAVPDMAPKTLRTEAMMTAWPGDNTLVETTVAMALGASVQPFTNSAAKTSRRVAIRAGSSIFQGNRFQHIGYIFAPVGCLF